MDSFGNLYGTTVSGGAPGVVGNGTIFEWRMASSTITTLASFNLTTEQDPYDALFMGGVRESLRDDLKFGGSS